MEAGAYILSIETATTACSVAISRNEELLACREVNNGYSHAENLHVFIRDVLRECGLSPKDLSAVAVSKGPGSYTGLRIGVSAAKGLCYALNIPLLSVDTLQSMAASVVQKDESALYVPMLDARRMEVYCAAYDAALKPAIPIQSLVLDKDSISLFETAGPLYFFGDGMEKAGSLLRARFSHAHFVENLYPSAKTLSVLAYSRFNEKKFEDVAYFEPFYLKEFFTPQVK